MWKCATECNFITFSFCGVPREFLFVKSGPCLKKGKNTAVDDDTLHLSLSAADCAYFFHKFK